MSRKGGLSNGGWLTVIAKAHLPADVLLWLDMSVFLLWLKREGGESPNAPHTLFFIFSILFPSAGIKQWVHIILSIHKNEWHSGVCKDANCPLQLPWRCCILLQNKLETGVCGILDTKVSNWLLCFHKQNMVHLHFKYAFNSNIEQKILKITGLNNTYSTTMLPNTGSFSLFFIWCFFCVFIYIIAF